MGLKATATFFSSRAPPPPFSCSPRERSFLRHKNTHHSDRQGAISAALEAAQRVSSSPALAALGVEAVAASASAVAAASSDGDGSAGASSVSSASAAASAAAATASASRAAFAALPPNRRRASCRGRPLEARLADLEAAAVESATAASRAAAPFEWADGPLTKAMRLGAALLIDEINLADDAVLERLNSVLEPGRTLTLAEKGSGGAGGGGGGSGNDSSDATNTRHSVFGAEVVVAAPSFRVLATMNPGGDYGKRELSPALANRFTTIWAPPPEAEAELRAMVAARIPNESAAGSSSSSAAAPLLAFWRAHVAASDRLGVAPPPLRDLLAAARLANDLLGPRGGGAPSPPSAPPAFSAAEAVAHAVHASLLDGASVCAAGGGGGNGEGSAAAELAREGARALARALGGGPPAAAAAAAADFSSPAAAAVPALSPDARHWGVPPFLLPVGELPLPRCHRFDFSAPAVSRNARRLLRALAAGRPVLVEGPPGVGKTALVSAVAAAAGRRLVRINLSEQTDVSDLLGADLPVGKARKREEEGRRDGAGEGEGAEAMEAPMEVEGAAAAAAAAAAGDEPSAPSSSSSASAAFAWVDGPLLSALKNGDWVLLDELNLAGQSVLEGLNAILDHRREVFLPELGRTVVAAPGFALFGAQNAAADGGGRRCLPRSFVSRFTRVRAEALREEDMRSVVRALHPRLPAALVSRMTAAVARLAEAAVGIGGENALAGPGRPWEFNLRDLMRWCDLVVADVGGKGGDDDERYVFCFFRPQKKTQKRKKRRPHSRASPFTTVGGPNLRVAEIELAPRGSASFYTLGLPPEWSIFMGWAFLSSFKRQPRLPRSKHFPFRR